MPNKMLFVLSKKHDVPVDELEKKWDKAKKSLLTNMGPSKGNMGF